MANHRWQHYVPQFLLRQFASPDTGKLWAYDMKSGDTFQTGSRAVGAEHNFNDFIVEGELQTIDPSLTRLEAESNPVINKLAQERSLESLTEAERVIVASFMVFQLLRTKAYRDPISNFAEQANKIARELYRLHGEDEGEPTISDEEVKRSSVEIITLAEECVPLLSQRHWILFATNVDCPFYLSDNPVLPQNWNDYGPYGGLGLKCKGIQFYLPLNPTLMLAIVDEDAKEKMCQISPNFSTAFQSGQATALSQRSVHSYNREFSKLCTRFVFSKDRVFEIAEEAKWHRRSDE